MTIAGRFPLQLGSFGGGYFRKIKSGVTKQVHEGAWEEFPEAWFKGLNIATHVASDVYNPAVNQYGVRSGKTMGRKDPFGLEAWETSGGLWTRTLSGGSSGIAAITWAGAAMTIYAKSNVGAPFLGIKAPY